MDWLKNFDVKRPWIAAIAVGTIVAGAASAVKDRDVAVIGIGIIACGFGEWFNHRMEMEIGPRGTLTTFERVNRPQGIALVVVGVLLLIIGIFRMLKG